jgi:hypothetical protein
LGSTPNAAVLDFNIRMRSARACAKRDRRVGAAAGQATEAPRRNRSAGAHVQEGVRMKAGISKWRRSGAAAILPFLLCLAPAALSAKTLDCDVVIGTVESGRLEFIYDADHKTLESSITAPGMYVDHNYKDRQWTPVLDKDNMAVFLSADRQRDINPILVLELDFAAHSVVEHRLGNTGVTLGVPTPWTCVARD